MKKAIFKTMPILGFLFFFCLKAWNTPPNNGTWTILGSTYNTDSCYAPACDSTLPCAITAQTPFDTSDISNFSQISIIFGSPPGSHPVFSLITDSILVNSLDSTQAYIQVHKGLLPSTLYQSINSGTLSVSVDSTGQISVASNSSISLQQIDSPSNTVQLDFNIAVSGVAP